MIGLKPGVATPHAHGYRAAVTVNPVAGFGDPSNLAHKRPIRQQALFLRLPLRVMAAVRGRASALPGSKFPVRQPAHSCHQNRLATIGDSSKPNLEHHP